MRFFDFMVARLHNNTVTVAVFQTNATLGFSTLGFVNLTSTKDMRKQVEEFRLAAASLDDLADKIEEVNK